MFAAHELGETDWLTAAPKVQIQVNSKGSKSGVQSLVCTLCGFQLKNRSTDQLYGIPLYSDPVQRHYLVAARLNCGKHNHIKYINQHKRPAKYHEKGNELMLSTQIL